MYGARKKLWEFVTYTGEEEEQIEKVAIDRCVRQPNSTLLYGHFQIWQLRLYRGKEDSAWELFFGFIPNPISLKLRGDCDYLFSKRIISPRYLSQLRTLEISDWTEWSPDVASRPLAYWKPSLHVYWQMVRHSSLQELVFTGLHISDVGPKSFLGLGKFLHPSITKIKFDNCLISKHMLCKLLRGCSHGLKSFEYTLDHDLPTELKEKSNKSSNALGFFGILGLFGKSCWCTAPRLSASLWSTRFSRHSQQSKSAI
jgi:hypothetical protein